MYITCPLLKRSVWKGPNVVALPIREAILNGTRIRTQQRSATILPQFVGLTFEIHNGKNYKPVKITEDMVGYKLGAFAHSRKKVVHKVK